MDGECVEGKRNMTETCHHHWDLLKFRLQLLV